MCVKMFRGTLQKHYWMLFTLIFFYESEDFSFVLPLHIHFWSINRICVFIGGWLQQICIVLGYAVSKDLTISSPLSSSVEYPKGAMRLGIFYPGAGVVCFFSLRAVLLSLHSSISAILLKKAFLTQVLINYCNAIKRTWHTWMQIFSSCLDLIWQKRLRKRLVSWLIFQFAV